ncbi:MAG: hypothetical protein NWF05_04245 [Candidatus Bathyarchaeota archaeon]|nr:hypothetical protein [Candidatus Bathyarchaeota archaeon]
MPKKGTKKVTFTATKMVPKKETVTFYAKKKKAAIIFGKPPKRNPFF